MSKPNETSISNIPIVSVSYNAPKLIHTLLKTIRQYYDNKIFIIDGSEEEKFKEIQLICGEFEQVELIHFTYNIHHGPGMAWAFQNLPLTDRVLVIDSDVIVVNPGFIESMNQELKPGMYGVGYLGIINEEGFDLDIESDIGIPYLHPACMLCNIDVVKQWPMPVKHGAPMTPTMIAIHNSKKSELLGRIGWLHKDFRSVPPLNYLIHDWQGTVKTVNSYALDEWMELAKKRKIFVETIANTVAVTAKQIVEIGESDGLLSRALKEKRQIDSYIAIQNSAAPQIHNKVSCDEIRLVNFENIATESLDGLNNADCWILDKAIENLRNPIAFLKRIRECIKPEAELILVAPNLLNWKLIEKLCKAVTSPDEQIEQSIRNGNMTLVNAVKLLNHSGFRLMRGLQMNINEDRAEEVMKLIALLGGAGALNQDMVNMLMTENYLLVAAPTDETIN